MDVQFSIPLPTLRDGDKIELEGTIAEDAETFTLNLVGDHQLGTKPRHVAYHHKMEFNNGRTIENEKFEGCWGEEKYGEEAFLAPGDTFEIMMTFDDNNVYIYFNGNQYGNYSLHNEMGTETIKYLQIWHGLDKMNSVKFTFAN